MTLGDHLAHVGNRPPECVDLGMVLAPLQELVSSHRQPVGWFKGMADDVVIHGRTPLSKSVNGRTLLVEHLFIIRDNVEIASNTYVVVQGNRTVAENSVSKSLVPNWKISHQRVLPRLCQAMHHALGQRTGPSFL